MTKLTSSAISAVRFPLIVAVVMLHTYLIDKPYAGKVWIASGDFPTFDIFCHFVQYDLANVSVSLFFIMSGYLFFQTRAFTFAAYKNKISRRFRSLFIPYFLWNTLYILYVALIGLVHPAFLTDKISFTNMNIGQIANAYWDLSQGLIPLWFIRDLMIINLIAPVIYFFIKKFGPLLPIILLVLWVMQKYVWIPGIGMRCSAFYVLGAYAGMNSDKTERLLDRFGNMFIVISFLLFVVETVLWYNGISNVHYYQFCLAVGAIGFFCFFRRGVSLGHIKVNKFLAEGSFFVFVFHMFVLKAPLLLCARFVPANTITGILALLIIPLLTSAICLLVYYAMHRTLPKVTKVLMGAR